MSAKLFEIHSDLHSPAYEGFRLDPEIFGDVPHPNSRSEVGNWDISPSEGPDIGVEQAGVALGALLFRCRQVAEAEALGTLRRLPCGARRSGRSSVDVVIGASAVGAALVALSASSATTWDWLRTDRVPSAAVSADPGTDMLVRGLRLRVLFQADKAPSPGQVAYLQQMDVLGAEIRLAAVAPTDLILADGDTTILPLDPDRPADGLVIVYSRAWARAAARVFDACWQSSRKPARVLSF